MFGVGLQELLVILVIALLVFGPQRLPELGRMIGRALRELRRASDEFRTTVETNLQLNDPDPLAEPSTLVTDASATAMVTEPTESLPSAVQVPAAETEASGAEPFCAKRGSRLVHGRDCIWVRRINEPERVYFKQPADARDQGLVACPVCEPAGAVVIRARTSAKDGTRSQAITSPSVKSRA